MATPTADQYSVASGVTLRAGRFAPPPGQALAGAAVAAGEAAGNLSAAGGGPKQLAGSAIGRATAHAAFSGPSDFASFRVDGAGGAAPVTFGQVFKKGDVPAGSSITSNAPAFQADVRNFWPDGSVRFAVLSAEAAPGTYSIGRDGAVYAAPDVAEPASLEAVMTFTDTRDATGALIAGGTLTAALSAARANGAVAWSKATAHKVRQILGPVMSEFHYYCPTADAHLAVWYYVRAYASGQIEVETVVENGWTRVPSPGKRDYLATLVINGATKYDQARAVCRSLSLYPPNRVDARTIDWPYDAYVMGTSGSVLYVNDGATPFRVVSSTQILNGNGDRTAYRTVVDQDLPPALTHVELAGHFAHTRWSRVDWAGTNPLAVLTHDTEYLSRSAMFIKPGATFLSSATLGSAPSPSTSYEEYAATPSLATQPDPASTANMDMRLGAGGYTEYINVVGPWHLVYQMRGHAGAKLAAEANVRGLGPYAIHYRDETTGAPIRASTPANRNLGIRAAGSGLSDTSGNSNELTPHLVGQGTVESFTFTHAPEVGYTHYLLSGRWMALDEQLFAVGTASLNVPQWWMIGEWKIGRPTLQVRERAFMYRNVVQASLTIPSHLRGASVAPLTEDGLQRHEITQRLNAEIEYTHASYIANTATAPANNDAVRSKMLNNYIGVIFQPSEFMEPTRIQVQTMMQAFNSATEMFACIAEASTDPRHEDIVRFHARWPTGVLGAAESGGNWDWRMHIGYATWLPLTGSWNDAYAHLTGPTYTWATGGGLHGPPSNWPADRNLRFVDTQSTTISPSVIDFVVGSSHTWAMGGLIALTYEAAAKIGGIPGADLMWHRYYNATNVQEWLAKPSATDATHNWMFDPPRRTAMSVPYELPAKGSVVAIGGYANDVCPSTWSGVDWQYSIFSSFGGGIFNPDYSPVGAWCVAGQGGHGHPDWIGGLAFDFSTGNWVRHDCANPGTFYSGADVYARASAGGIPVSNDAWREVVGGEPVPAPPHPYGTGTFLRQGAKGSLLYVSRTAIGSPAAYAPGMHMFDFATNLWSRPNNNTVNCQMGEESHVIWDAPRARWWLVPQAIHSSISDGKMPYLDSVDLAFKKGGAYSGYFQEAISGFARGFMWRNFIVRPVQVGYGEPYDWYLWCYDPDDPTRGWRDISDNFVSNNGLPAKPWRALSASVANLLPRAQNNWALHSDGNFYAISADSTGNELDRIVPPDNPLTGQWTHSRITLAGASLPRRFTSDSGSHHYSRLIYVPGIDCLAWISHGQEQVRLLRP